MRIGKMMIGLWMCLFLLTLPAVAAADDSWSKVQQRGELIVGFCAQYPPFESKNEKTAEFEGFDVDLGKAVARQMGVKVRFVDAEWQGLLAGLKKGDYDVLITCMSKSEARNENVNMSDIYYTLPDVIVVRQDESVIRDRDGLKGKIVGVQLGSGSEQLADQNRELFKEIKRYNYNPEAFTDLKHKRIDAVIVGYAYAVNQIKTDPSYKVVGKPLAEANIVIVAARGADALTARINQSLSAVRTEGTYQRILDQWLKVD